MICNTIGLTADSFETLYVHGGAEVPEVYGSINYAHPIFYSLKTLTGATSYSFMGYPEPLKSYEISGNLVQNDTPTPTSPIYPQECGDNEYSDNLLKNGTYTDTLDLSTGLETLVNERIVLTGNENINYYGRYGRLNLPHFYIDFGAEHNIDTGCGSLLCTHYASSDEEMGIGDFCCRYQVRLVNKANVNRIYFVDSRFTALSQFVSYVRNQYESGTPIVIQKIRDETHTKTINIPEGLSGYVYGYSNQDGTPSPVNVIEIQNNSFNYYKIPITCGGETKNIYLTEPLLKIGNYADVVNSDGTVTRRIRKRVLTGEETIDENAGRYIVRAGLSSSVNYIGKCTHFVNKSTGTVAWFDNKFSIESVNIFFGVLEMFDSIAAFRQLLTDSYAAGNPVTVWYVLTTPTTETITSPAVIPITGSNTLSIDTTLAPSSVSITGHVKPTSG